MHCSNSSRKTRKNIRIAKKTPKSFCGSKIIPTFAAVFEMVCCPAAAAEALQGRIPEWPNGADCKSAGARLRWFESIFAHRDICGSSSVDRALAFQAGGRGFEPRLPLNVRNETCCCSSVVEHFLGKEEVTSSILVNSSTDAGWWLATKRNSNNRSFNNHL